MLTSKYLDIACKGGLNLKIELSYEELKTYKPKLTRKNDFDLFWSDTLTKSAGIPLSYTLDSIDYPIKEIKVYDLNYDGFNGNRVNGWYILPSKKAEGGKYPAVIYYHGYTRNKGYVYEYLKWLIQGYAVVAISVRGQGGKTPDNGKYSQGSVTGWMTNGILDKNEYIYRSIYVDAVRAVDFLHDREEIDKERIGIYGLSQGGGISLAVAGLDSRVKFAMPIYPYLCHFERGVEYYQEGPYGEIYEYFRFFDPELKSREQVFDTLSYFDGMNFAPNIKCPVLFAVCLADLVCPPSTIFAAYNHIDSEKKLKVYPSHGHEPLPFHEESMIEFVNNIF